MKKTLLTVLCLAVAFGAAAQDGKEAFHSGGLFCGKGSHGRNGHDRRQGVRNAACESNNPQ